GLRCLVRTGTWNIIRRLDVPAMLTLTTPTGERHYATVTGLDADTVTLELGPRATTQALNDVERFWDGAFVALWRTPDLAAAPVAAVSASRYVTLGIASVSLITLFAVLWIWAHEVPAPTPASARPVASIAAVSTSSEPTQTARPHMAAEDAPRVPLTAIEPA